MTQTASREDFIAVEGRLMMAMELGWKKWRLAFGAAMGQKAWQVVIPARDVAALSQAVRRARERFGLPQGCPVFSCYEAGRDGFWIDRLLSGMGITNLVVDSSSIEVKRRARRVKTDRIDVAKLLSMLLRYFCGERGLWSVVHVPTPECEDSRQLPRQIRTTKKDRARSINRIKALLATQGVAVRMGCRGLLESLDSIRIWDGSPLPAGLRLRLGSEVARHAFLHRQLLDLEGQRDSRIRTGQDRASKVARHLMTLKSVGQVSASTFS